MNTPSHRHSFPVVGVVAHNYLRESGLLRMMEKVRVAIFATAESPLHRIADFSCPLPSLDISEEELDAAIESAIGRGIPLIGLTSWRDHNVPGVARIADRRGWKCIPVDCLTVISSKSAFRDWLNSNLDASLHTVVQFAHIPFDVRWSYFRKEVSELLRDGPVILKPDKGSCSYHVIRLQSEADLDYAWQRFRSSSHYRGGDFIAEQEIDGELLSAETIAASKARCVLLTQYVPADPGLHYEVGHFVTSEEPLWANDMRNLAIAVHSRLGLSHLLSHLEAIVPRSGLPAIVELNPRIAGDKIPELHLHVNGVDIYGACGQIAAGMEICDLQDRPKPKYGFAVIRFHRPVVGKLRVDPKIASFLESPHEEFGLLQSTESVLTGGDTNDDRSAYIMMVGNDMKATSDRAKRALEECLLIETV